MFLDLCRKEQRTQVVDLTDDYIKHLIEEKTKVELEDEKIFEEAFDKVNQALNEMHWYDKKVFELVQDTNNISALSNKGQVMKLYKGNCLDIMKTIQDKSIDAIITDPPYGTTACKWDSVIDFGLMWEQLNRIIKPNGAIVLFGSEPFCSTLRMSNIKNYKYDWIWQKSHATGHLNSKRQPLRQHENICVFYKKQSVYNPQMTDKTYIDKRTISGADSNADIYGDFKKVERQIPITKGYPKTIQYFAKIKGGEGGKHPTQKPVALMEYLIKTYTNKNETVLDFTMGSGSTGIACINTNRNFIGIEMDDNYFNIAKKRIKEHTKQNTLWD
jgi:site-specific DNA-methyltransferase (adenine-specific)